MQCKVSGALQSSRHGAGDPPDRAHSPCNASRRDCSTVLSNIASTMSFGERHRAHFSERTAEHPLASPGRKPESRIRGRKGLRRIVDSVPAAHFAAEPTASASRPRLDQFHTAQDQLCITLVA